MKITRRGSERDHGPVSTIVNPRSTTWNANTPGLQPEGNPGFIQGSLQQKAPSQQRIKPLKRSRVERTQLPSEDGC